MVRRRTVPGSEIKGNRITGLYGPAAYIEGLAIGIDVRHPLMIGSLIPSGSAWAARG
jgi:hypothetical protein